MSDLVTGGRRRGSLDLSGVLDGFVNSGALKGIMDVLGPSLPESGHASSEQQSPPADVSGPEIRPKVVGAVHAGYRFQGLTNTPPSTTDKPIPQSRHRDRNIRSETALAAISRPLPSADEILNGAETDDGEGPRDIISND